jgi:hypothetical protein
VILGLVGSPSVPEKPNANAHRWNLRWRWILLLLPAASVAFRGSSPFCWLSKVVSLYCAPRARFRVDATNPAGYISQSIGHAYGSV